MVAWSITEVARMAGVTSRTLRHYDDIGLVRPAYVGRNGYRYYEREQLLRLQEVLVLRELGLGLETITQVLSGARDRLDALRQHERRLLSERDRLARLARTLSRTIAQLEGGPDMPAEEMFDGFERMQAEAETEYVERYGEGVREHFATSRERTTGWNNDGYVAVQQAGEELEVRIADAMRDGARPEEPRTQALVAEHYAGVAQFWTPDRESYTGLGRLYVEDARFREHYETRAPGLAEFLCASMAVYATRSLT